MASAPSTGKLATSLTELLCVTVIESSTIEDVGGCDDIVLARGSDVLGDGGKGASCNVAGSTGDKEGAGGVEDDHQ